MDKAMMSFFIKGFCFSFAKIMTFMVLQANLLKKYTFYFLLAVFFSLQARASASDTLVFSGSLSVSGAATYKYKVVVVAKEGRWRGYSVLDEGGADETKSSVGAQFSKEKGGMVFTEYGVLSSKSKEQSFCFVNAVLKLSGKSMLKGFFMGHDKQKNMCGNGTLKLSAPPAAVQLMKPDGTRDTMPKIVTEAISQSFQTTSKEVYLELWDGGAMDQDSLTVSLNGTIIAPAFEITAQRRKVSMSLKKGMNTISIKALNEGSQAPNSARIYFDDGTDHYTLVSYLKTGQEATIKVNSK
jgi:hypothetical protein